MTIARGVVWAGVVCALHVAGAAAHEAQHHQGTPGSGVGHADAMQAVKDRVPPELGGLLEPPVPASPGARETAAKAYAEHCAACHGEAGKGDGPLADVLPAPPVDFGHPMHADFYTAGERFWIITHGLPELEMPPFGDVLDEETRWGLVRHILELQQQGR
ncbi:MAG: cytochrome c [Deferrisomatales bacterium]|nr:cytochrome c [Deferrisomatales bacterium]